MGDLTPDELKGPDSAIPSALKAAFPALSRQQIYEALVKRARDGSGEAGFQAWILANECTSVLDSSVAQLSTLPVESKEYIQTASSLKSLKTECGELTRVRDSDRFALLRDAAAAGDRGAMRWYRLEGPPGGWNLPEQDPNALEWDRTSLRYIQNLAAEADISSIAQLAALYRRGTPSQPADPQQALTYQILTKQVIVGAGVDETTLGKMQDAIDAAAQSLGPEGAAAAYAKAGEITAGFPKKGGAGH